MAFAGVNYLAVVLAAVASFIFGGLWYGALSKQWMAAAGKTEAEMKSADGPMSMVPFAIAFVAQLVMAYMLAGVMGHLGTGAGTIRSGLITGFFIWLGFVFSSLVVNHAFQGAKRSLTLIDGGHWLGVLLIQGAVIGAFGLR